MASVSSISKKKLNDRGRYYITSDGMYCRVKCRVVLKRDVGSTWRLVPAARNVRLKWLGLEVRDLNAAVPNNKSAGLAPINTSYRDRILLGLAVQSSRSTTDQLRSIIIVLGLVPPPKLMN